MKKISLLFGLFVLPIFLFCQNTQKEGIGLEFAQTHLLELGVSGEDIQDMIITDHYTSRHNGVTHIYYNQAYKGIPVHNALFNVNISKDNEVFHYGNRLYPALESKIKGETPQINPVDALAVQLNEVGLGKKEIPQLLKRESDTKFVFAAADYSEGNISVDLKYYPQGDDLVLAYEVKLLEKENPNYWHTVVNAVTGEIINHKDETLYCSFHDDAFHNHDRTCLHAPKANNLKAPVEEAVSGSYRVYALPAESPIHGSHELVVNPHDPIASPFGWHDIDGADGPEYTITRGNNVHAFRDADDTGISSGDEPDGGIDLVFDFPHNQMEEPDSSIAADITNLFYMNNMMHDIAYKFGFDEVSGNFQSNNYGNGGQPGDHVNAQGQDGANLLDGDHLNNANFATPSDGSSGRMQMYYWSITQSSTFINEPAELAGGLEVVVPNATDWGFVYSTQFSQLDITKPVVVVDDGSGNGASRGCGDLINGDEINGNIALIDRGICQFGTKSLNAQNAGAVAVLICNVPGVNGGDGEEGVSMSGGVDGAQVTIPALFMKYSDCVRIKASIDAGVPVIININERDQGLPDYYSSSFDNGVVAHEYGHGISTRLTGGPSTSGCLGNEEQMGEGWSDYFGLITSVEPGDLGSDRRGIGNYVDGTTVNGRGIRRFPYSTDMNINPQTLNDIFGQGVHATGEVWAGVLWDLYWAFVDAYGYDEDLNNTESGNFKAVQLVFDGMKFQPCGPGFLDGRDAILMADQINYNGENQCLIWEIFARRGMGFYADQNDPDSNTDNVEDYEPLPTCIKELKIRKSISNVFVPGEEAEVVLSFANHTESMESNVRITDDLPENTVFVSHDSEYDFEIVGNTIVFEIGDMPSITEDTIRYIVQPDPSVSSAILY
ncbi:MAG: DUF11 domain-containing protein, partial [Saprospiraceae bacterium]|nr:DUF11 domain-containing protein [Saprospiraceae bacterium]